MIRAMQASFIFVMKVSISSIRITVDKEPVRKQVRKQFSALNRYNASIDNPLSYSYKNFTKNSQSHAVHSPVEKYFVPKMVFKVQE